MNCPVCGSEIVEDARFCGRCGVSLSPPASIVVERTQDNAIRYHGLDALRGVAMLLGIVLHAALPYTSNMEAFWPSDESPSHLVTVIFHFIHVWRMPVFFILTGFFANLIISRRSWSSWWGNRLLRIGLPIIVFTPVMSAALPWIFSYGKTGEFIPFYSNAGQPFHLWFLWHLIIFVILTATFRPLYLGGVGVLRSLNRIGLGFIGTGFRKSRSVFSITLFQSRFPIVFIISCVVMNFSTGGELIGNVGASLLYFGFGYSLYKNPSLFMFMKAHWRYYFLAGLICFILFMMATLAIGSNLPTDIYSEDMTGVVGQGEGIKLLWLSQYLLKIVSGVLFSFAFIGLAENRFGSYNVKSRFISDGAYWMYLVHLPLVTLITFFMFSLDMPAEIKFLIAVVGTSIICLVTYKYLVRSTPIGILLNGRRHPFRMAGL